VYGNRKAVKFTLPNGSWVYIMVRCGNPVYPSQPPGIPEGPTDNPPPPKTEPKDPSKDPYQQGNAPEGGGRNKDSGPGEYKDPKDMDKPGKDPYVPPSTPSPTPGNGNGGGK